MSGETHQNLRFVLIAFLLLVAVWFSLMFGGSSQLHWRDIAGGDFVFWELRLPKTLTAIAAGATLAVSGLLLQVVFRNPLAGPYVLGISSGAALMVALGLMLRSATGWLEGYLEGRYLMVTLSIAGSLVMTFLILTVSSRVRNNVVLLLIGLMFSQICSAIQGTVEYFADPGALKMFVVWGMGSLSGTSREDVGILLSLSLIGIAGALMMVKPLNAFLLGEHYAQNLGVSFRRSRFLLILVSSALTGVTTAFCGPIAFAGIAVPILSRMIFPTAKQQVHIFSCLLLGPLLLLISDGVTNTLIEGQALPVNVITTIIGAPVVIYLMFRNRRW